MNFPTKNSPRNGVVVAIDVDNLLISFMEGGEIPGFKEGLRQKPQDLTWLGKFSIKAGFENVFNWIKTFGQILCVHLYLPYSQTANDALWHGIWQDYKNEFLVEAIYCPKKPIDTRRAGKDRPTDEKPDNVDAHLIEHTKKMIELYGDKVGYFCLMSGDSDYGQLLRQLIKQEIKVAFVLGSKKSFSSAYKEGRVAGIHPETKEELVHYFAPRRSEKV
jgi:hypothetical protein